LSIGAVVCSIEEGGSGTSEKNEPAPEAVSASENSAKAAEESEVIQIKVPAVGESISEVTLSKWLKSDGDFVNMDEEIAELESDKATYELTAERAGVLTRIAKEGDKLSIGDVVCSIETGKETAAKPSESKADKPQSAAADRKQDYAAGTPSPAAAKILAEKGVNAGEVSGTGVGGRITKDDAVKAKSQPVVNSSQPAAA